MKSNLFLSIFLLISGFSVSSDLCAMDKSNLADKEFNDLKVEVNSKRDQIIRWHELAKYNLSKANNKKIDIVFEEMDIRIPKYFIEVYKVNDVFSQKNITVLPLIKAKQEIRKKNREENDGIEDLGATSEIRHA